jgi:hypothetical protein
VAEATMYIGWVYLRGHWRKVCASGSLAECSRLLGEHGALLGVPTLRQCLTGGGPPRYVPGKASALPASSGTGARAARGPAGSENAAPAAMETPP